jgi:hypothetical protein
MKYRYTSKWDCGYRSHAYAPRGPERRTFVLADGRTGIMRVDHLSGGWMYTVRLDDGTAIASTPSWGESRKDKAMSIASRKLKEWASSC